MSNYYESIRQSLDLLNMANRDITQHLDNGNFANGTNCIYTSPKKDVRVEIYFYDPEKCANECLGWGTMSGRAKYSTKIYFENIPKPFRMEIDNINRSVHFNSNFEDDNHKNIPFAGTHTINEMKESIMGTCVMTVLEPLITRHIQYSNI